MSTFTNSRLARSVALSAAAAAFAVGSAHAQSNAPLSPEAARQAVAPFYDMLNNPATKDLKALADRALAPGWRSYSSDKEFKERDALVAQFTGIGKAIPDLTWEIKEVLVAGDRVVVRSEASGTPQGPFFGVPPSGKSFRIMAIDVHTVRDGKLVTAYHVEDWAGAIRQLTAK